MKLLQVSDLHIDSKMETHFSSLKAKERNHEILITFEKLFEVLENENYSAMLIVGDMFDTKKMTSKSFSYIIELIRKHSSKMFFYVPGNHDYETSLANNVEDIPKNLIIFDSDFSKFSLSEKVCVGGIKLTNHNSTCLKEQINFDRDKINIMLLHGAITKTSSKVDNENFFFGDIKGHNIDYLALGHIHSYTSGKIDNRGEYAYSGCLEPRGFDEFGEKGYICIDINENTNTVSHKFIKFAKRKFLEINVDITNCTSSREILDKIYDAIKSESLDNIIKIILTGTYEENTTKGIDLIELELNEKYYFAKVVDNSKLRINIDDYKGSFSLKGIFIKKVLESKKIPDEKKDSVILMGIKALELGEVE